MKSNDLIAKAAGVEEKVNENIRLRGAAPIVIPTYDVFKTKETER